MLAERQGGLLIVQITNVNLIIIDFRFFIDFAYQYSCINQCYKRDVDFLEIALRKICE